MSPTTWPTDPWVEPTLVPTSDGTTLAVRVLAGDRRPVRPGPRTRLQRAALAPRWPTSCSQSGSCGRCGGPAGPRSLRPADDGHTTAQASADLRDVLEALGWQDDRPVLAGQSWGGNVVLRAAHDDSRWGAAAAVDGGWIHLGRRFASFDDCWYAAGTARPRRTHTGRASWAGSARWSPTGRPAHWTRSRGTWRWSTVGCATDSPASTTGRSCTPCGPTTPPTSTRPSRYRCTCSWPGPRRPRTSTRRTAHSPTPPSAGTRRRTTTSICSSRRSSSSTCSQLSTRVRGSGS